MVFIFMNICIWFCLGVNIDYVVIVWKVCGEDYFDLVCVVLFVLEVGVDLIIVYFWEDRCYICDVDIENLKSYIFVLLNFEMVFIDEMFKFVL